MTALAFTRRLPRLRLARRGAEVAVVPPLTPRMQLGRAGAVSLCALAVGLVLELTVVSSFQQRASQQRAFDRLRAELATGTAPLGGTDADGELLPLGTPLAYLEIPSIGLRQVVVEGTTAETLFTGPGHRRDTPLPGQAGTSLVVGRRAAYGGPFARIGDLERGATIHVTTGQGEFDYRVLGVRRAGERQPSAAKTGSGRLVLATADGRAFIPSDVLWVDADLTGPAVGAAGSRIGTSALPTAEKLMASDLGTLWALAMWLQALILVIVGGMWAWHRWGRAQAWVVFLPPLLLVGLAASGEAAKLLPNLL